MFVLNYKSNISHLSYIGELSAEYPQGPALLYRGHTYCRVMDHGSCWGKSGQHAPKYYSFGIMTVCVCSESVGKSPIPRARPAAARCVATRLSNTNVFWRHSELRQRQGSPNPTSLLQLFLSTQSSISASECICLCFGNLNLIKHNISTEKLLMSAELLVTWLH